MSLPSTFLLGVSSLHLRMYVQYHRCCTLCIPYSGKIVEMVKNRYNEISIWRFILGV